MGASGSRKCQIFLLTTRFSSEIFTIHWPLFISFLSRHKFSAFWEKFYGRRRERESGKVRKRETNKEIKRWTITYKFWRIVFVITFELGKNIPSCSRELWFKSATIDEIHFSSEIKKVRTLPFFPNFSPSISFLFSLSLSFLIIYLTIIRK